MGLLIPASCWMVIVLIRDMQFEISVARLVGGIFENIPSFAVVLLVGLTVGLVGGFSTLSGNLIRSIIVNTSKEQNHNG